jgi:hypothetical protein
MKTDPLFYELFQAAPQTFLNCCQLHPLALIVLRAALNVSRPLLTKWTNSCYLVKI